LKIIKKIKKNRSHLALKPIISNRLVLLLGLIDKVHRIIGNLLNRFRVEDSREFKLGRDGNNTIIWPKAKGKSIHLTIDYKMATHLHPDWA